nr:hypothetical protein [Bacteroidota bacterium]
MEPFFFETENKMAFVCAANQISKSSTQIRKAIHWATAVNLWPKLWKTAPRQFWYLYPSRDIATVEFEKKWVPEFLPRGDYKDHPVYGWRAKYSNKYVTELIFNTGVSIYFKTYSQDVMKLQAGTVHYIATDEELPVELFDELILRLAASDGHFSMVFTATMGQDLWHRTIERAGKNDEEFPDAFKRQVSMYDCLKYEDGTDSPWTVEKIQLIKNKCPTDASIQRRVNGRFIVSEGLKYPEFNYHKNVTSAANFKNLIGYKGDALFPPEWLIYGGVDIGSGGTAHPSAITFIAVAPDYKVGIVFRGWRGDKSQTTTSADTLDKYRMLRGKLKPTHQSYDYQAKDFHTFASRLGETFMKAEKGHEIGEDTLNTLFKNQMLWILDDETLYPLTMEFQSLTNIVKKTHAKDDFIDSCRYCAVPIPWNWEAITDQYVEYEEKKKLEITEEDMRRNAFFGEEELDDIEREIEEYNEMCEG